MGQPRGMRRSVGAEMVFGCFDQSGDLLVGFSELMNGFAQWLLGDEDDLARYLVLAYRSHRQWLPWR